MVKAGPRVTASEPLRWVRGAVLSAVASLVGISAHVYAGGLLPGPGLIAGCYLVGVVIGVALLEGQASRLRVVALTVGGQMAMHSAMSLSGGHIGQPAGEPEGWQGLSYVIEHLIADALADHGLMTLSHIAAAAVVGLWLAAGERALWTLLSLAFDCVIALVRRPWFAACLHLPVLRVAASIEVAAPAELDACVGGISRRGPPLRLAA